MGLYQKKPISQSFTLFMNNILQYFHLSFPLEKKKVRYKNRNPWITQELKNDIKIRDELYKLKRRSPTPENIKNYNTYKNANLSKQRKAERDYYNEQFELHKNDLKNSWKIIKEMIGKVDKHRVNKHTTFLINNHYSSDTKIIANHFNEYFINVGSSLAKNINGTDIDPLMYVQPNRNTIHIPKINAFEIKSVISSFSNSAAGYDELPASIMKQLINYYAEPLTHLINQSILQGLFPEEMKIAKVIPIYKCEDEQLVTNYRPISILPFFSQVFEKIIYNYIIEFMEENKLFDCNQFGFRKQHSTSHAIITLVEKVSKALDTGKIVVGVFLDLKKAFDTVDHTILSRKLQLYGIRGNIHAWLDSYLNNRSQFVHYNDHNSGRKHITHGVPQGSILGPLLFIIYINDFSRASELLFSMLFADDTSVFIEGTNYDKMIDILNNELKRVDIWLKANKITINTKKTHYMMFHRTRIKGDHHPIIIGGNPLTYFNNTQFLGVIIDHKLKWSNHIL